MSTKQNTGIGFGAQGSAITVANSGGSSGDAWDSISPTGAATLTVETANPPVSGHKWSKITSAAGGSDRLRMYHSLSASDIWACRFYFMYEVDPGAANVVWAAVDTAFAQAVTLQVTTVSSTRHLQLTSAGTMRKDFGTLSFGTASTNRYMVDLYIIKGSPNGTLAMELRDSTGTLVDSYSSTAVDTGTLQFIRNQFGGNTGIAQAMRVGTIKVNNDTAAFQGAAAANVVPTVTFPARPIPQATGTVTGTVTFADTDGTIASVEVEIMSAPGDGGAPPDNPTVGLSNSGLNTATCVTTYSFTGAPGRYRIRARATDNSGGVSAYSYQYHDIYPASNADVLPYRRISGTDTVVGAANEIAAWTDGNASSYTESTNSPVNQTQKVEWCAFGPGPITFKIGGYQNPTSPTVTVDVDVYLNNDTTLVYNATPFNAPAANAETTITVDSAGEAIASVGANRAALVTRITSNQ